MRRRRREDKERGSASKNTRFEKWDEKDEEEDLEVVKEERAAQRRWRAMLTAVRREAWREVRWMSAR